MYPSTVKNKLKITWTIRNKIFDLILQGYFSKMKKVKLWYYDKSPFLRPFLLITITINLEQEIEA